MEISSRSTIKMAFPLVGMLLAVSICLLGLQNIDQAKAAYCDCDGPWISGIGPEGTITTDSTSIVADLATEGDSFRPASVAVTLDGAPVTGCTVEAPDWNHAYPYAYGGGWVDCPVSGLAAGEHSYTISATDRYNALSTAYGSFTVQLTSADTIAPSIDSIVPSGYKNSTSADVAVYYSDAGSGVNPASVSVTWDGTALACAAVSDVYASCPQTGLPQGSHTIGISLADNAGNPAADSGTVFIDNRSPSVMSGYAPANNATINTASPTISFTAYDRLASGYSDPATTSGVDFSTIVVTLDGSAISCSVDSGTGAVSCPTSGLAEGAHTWNYTFKDMAGNERNTNRSFTVQTCTSGQPALGLASASPFWASYADYVDRMLSVSYAVSNGAGSNNAVNVQIVGASATNGVTLASTAPVSVGDIAMGSSANVTLVYSVPNGVGSFKSTISATAQDACGGSYSYPTP